MAPRRVWWASRPMQRSPRRRLGKSAWPMKVTLIHWLARQLTARLAQSTPRLLRRPLRPPKAAAEAGAKAEAEAFQQQQLRLLPPRAEAVAALTPLWQASGRQEHQCGQPVRLPAVLPPSRRCLAASRCGHCCPRVPSALLPRATHHLHLLTTARRREQGKGGTHADLLSRLLRPVKHAQRELTSGLLEPLAWPLWLVRVVVSLLGISWSSVTRVHVKIPRSVVTYQVRIKVALHSTYVLRSLFTALTYYVVTPLENRQSRHRQSRFSVRVRERRSESKSQDFYHIVKGFV